MSDHKKEQKKREERDQIRESYVKKRQQCFPHTHIYLIITPFEEKSHETLLILVSGNLLEPEADSSPNDKAVNSVLKPVIRGVHIVF